MRIEVFTSESLENFFKNLGCRTTVTETKAGVDLSKQVWPKIVIKVPRRYYHFIRATMAERAPMGVLWDVQTLGFFENRITKYKFNRSKE